MEVGDYLMHIYVLMAAAENEQVRVQHFFPLRYRDPPTALAALKPINVSANHSDSSRSLKADMSCSSGKLRSAI